MQLDGTNVQQVSGIYGSWEHIMGSATSIISHLCLIKDNNAI
jgi:hypothetical protein